jgi:NAD(P)-dependent dehydrogenase (short-subunit alcohol dehydrogenase family)
MESVHLNKGKVAIVTGAGGGIGREIALALARSGAAVVVNDIGASLSGQGGSTDPGEETKTLIEAEGGMAVVDTHSVATWETARAIVETAIASFGRVDTVVNNAGITRDSVFHKMPAEDWLAVVGVHLHGSFFVSRAAAEYFRKQESGAFIHITSASGLIGNFGQANYSAAKLGICALSKSIALDMRRFNVRSNCLAPFAWSRMTSEIPADNEDQKRRVERLKKMLPEKNAPLVVFLGSDEARDITGQIFAVRNNELFVFSQSRPIRSVHRAEGWTAQSIAEHALPAIKANLAPLDRSQDVFSWDPI